MSINIQEPLINLKVLSQPNGVTIEIIRKIRATLEIFANIKETSDEKRLINSIN